MGTQDLVDLSSALLEGAGVQVYLWDAAQRLLVPEAGNQLALADGPAPREIGVGAAGRAVQCGKPLMIDDYRSSVGASTPAGVAGVTAAMGAPLFIDGRLVGAISVGVDCSRPPLGPDEFDAFCALTSNWASTDGLGFLEAIYCLYRRRAFGLALHALNDRQAAEDVVQDVFLSVWRSRARYNATRGSLSTWVLAVVRNRAIDWLRANGRQPVLRLSERESELSNKSDPMQDAEQFVDRADIHVALLSLTREQQEVIELAYFCGLSHSDIAKYQQLPIGTVKGRIRLALNRLRNSFIGECEAPRSITAAPPGTDLRIAG